MPDLVGSGKNDGDHARVWAHPLAQPAFAWHMRRIFGTGEARNFKFGVRIDLGKSHLMSDKIA